MTVFDLQRGEIAEVVAIDSTGAERARLTALGIERGAKVGVLGFSLFKSSVLVGVGYTRVAMRKKLAVRIEVRR